MRPLQQLVSSTDSEDNEKENVNFSVLLKLNWGLNSEMQWL